MINFISHIKNIQPLPSISIRRSGLFSILRSQIYRIIVSTIHLISIRKNMQSFPSVSTLPFRLSYTSIFNSITKVFRPEKKSLIRFDQIRFDNSLSSVYHVNFTGDQLRGETKTFYGHMGIVVSIEGARSHSINLENSYHIGCDLLIGYHSCFSRYSCKTICSSHYESERWSGIDMNIASLVDYCLSYLTRQITTSFCQCVDYVNHKILSQISLLSDFDLQSIGKNTSDGQKIPYDYGVSPSCKYLICEEKRVNVTTYQSSNYSFAAQRA